MSSCVSRIVLLAVTLLLSGFLQAAPPVIAHLQSYQQQGVNQADAEAGRELWYSTHGNRSCTSCHAASPTLVGKHVKTGKPIKPMALSVNAERFQDVRKIEKWFLRNCKWTLGRVCSTQEKADILTWLGSQ